MGQILHGIWQNAPVWVWPLFVVLIGIGVLAMRDRKSSVIPYIFYPLFGLTAANGMAALVHTPTNWIVFALAYALGSIVAFRWQDGLIVAKAGWTIQVRGDRITILILMVIFLSNFINGVVQAIAPDMRDSLAFTIAFAGIIGAGSGSFTGRALRVLTLPARAARA